MAKKKKLPLPPEWRKQPFAMFFSGVEGNTHFNVAKSAGADHMLMSYFHCKKLGEKKMQERFGDGQIKLLVDSGAHTFHNEHDKYKDKPMSFWEKYIEEYLTWAENHKDYIMAIVELDIEDIVGMDTLWKWREEYFLEFEERTGIPVCYVYRPDRQPLSEWVKMCKKFRYVGFSGFSDKTSVANMRKLIALAKKFGSVVHGFAMTKPSILPQLPFFSVDSISWKMGEMYGVTYIWDGKKFHTITKDKKERARRRFKQKLIAQGCNWDLYIKDDNNEVTRMNAIAWVQVMNWVRDRLKTKMYWLDSKYDPTVTKKETKKIIKRNADEDVPDDTESEDMEADLIQQKLHEVEFPTVRWFKGAMRDLDEWCRKLNINPELDREVKELALHCMTTLCTIARGETEFLDVARDSYSDKKVLRDLTFLFLEKEIDDEAVALEELTDFFIEVVEGKNDYFYTKDFEEMEGDAPPEPMERDDYVTEDDDEFDVQENAMIALDDMGLPQLRDSKGRFLPGHTVRKPKNIYSAKYPKLACDTCYVAQSCPKFRPGYICAYSKLFERFNLRDPADLINQLISMAELNGQRIQRVAIFEMLEGGAIDPNLSALMQMQVGLLREVREIHEALSAPKVTSLHNPDTEITIKTRNPQSGSILERLFSPTYGKSEKPEEDIVDAEFEVKDEEEEDEFAELNEVADKHSKEPRPVGLRRSSKPLPELDDDDE